MPRSYVPAIGFILSLLASCSQSVGGGARYEMVSLLDNVNTPVNGSRSFGPPTIIDADTVFFGGGNGVHIFDVGKTERLYPAASPIDFRTATYGTAARASYYATKGGIARFRDGKEELLFGQDTKLPDGRAIGRVAHLAAEGNMLAFTAQVSPNGEGRIVALKDGKLTAVLGTTIPIKAPYVDDVAVDSEQVYVLYENAVYARVGDQEKKIIGPGEPIPGGSLEKARGMSVRKGLLALSATVKIDGEALDAILSIQGGNITVIARRPAYGDGGFDEVVATNGKEIVYVEHTGGTVNVGKFKNGRTPSFRMMVYDGTEHLAVVEGGTELFGGIVGSAEIGSAAIDTDGNIAVAYGFDGPNNVSYGIAVARPKR